MILPDTWRRGGGVVAVIGLGKSGVAATTLLAREGVRVYASDASDHPYGGDAVTALRGYPGVEVDVGTHDLAKIRAAAGVVLSPGVPPDAPPASRSSPRSIWDFARCRTKGRAASRSPGPTAKPRPRPWSRIS